MDWILALMRSKFMIKKKNAIWREKNTIAIANEDEIFSVGDEAYEMFEKAPDNIEVVFPMKEGVISHFYDMQYLLNNLLKRNAILHVAQNI